MGYVIKGKQYTIYGDMLKATYDSDNDGKVDSAEVADSATMAVDSDKLDGKHGSDYQLIKANQYVEMTNTDTYTTCTATNENAITLTVTKAGTYLIQSYIEIRNSNSIAYDVGANLLVNSTIVAKNNIEMSDLATTHSVSMLYKCDLAVNDTVKINVISESSSYYGSYRRGRVFIQEL